MTFKKSVAVRVTPELSVPRTVSRAGPGEAAALIDRVKVPGVPAVRFPGLTENPAGRFGKSMNTVPVKPVPATICTVIGSVLFCVTGAGVLAVVAGSTLSAKSGWSTSIALALAVTAPEVSRPVMVKVNGAEPVTPVGAAVGANTVKFTVDIALGEGFGENCTVTDWFPTWPCPVKLSEPMKPPIGATVKEPLTEPPMGRSVLKSCKLTIWKDGAAIVPKAKIHEPTFRPLVLPPLGQLTTAA